MTVSLSLCSREELSTVTSELLTRAISTVFRGGGGNTIARVLFGICLLMTFSLRVNVVVLTKNIYYS